MERLLNETVKEAPWSPGMMSAQERTRGLNAAVDKAMATFAHVDQKTRL